MVRNTTIMSRPLTCMVQFRKDLSNGVHYSVPFDIVLKVVFGRKGFAVSVQAEPDATTSV